MSCHAHLVRVLVVALCVAAPVRANAPPNIVVIVSDDHRADILGCAGHPIVRTPNLDALAARGVRFTDAFVTTSICAASRATILTGRRESTHGYTFGTPPLTREHSAWSYPARLRAVGYYTGFVGKFGVSLAEARDAQAEMFDVFKPLHRTPYVKTFPDGSTRHVTDLIGDAAMSFIANAPEDRPFCLSVSFNAGHAEDGDLDQHYPPPPDESALYADLPMPRPTLDGDAAFARNPAFLRDSMNRDRYFWRWDTPEKYDRNLRNYFRMLTGLDRNVGRVVEALAARGGLDRTVIIFLGDNGYYMAERGFAGKWSHFDESLRVPMIVVDPRLPAEGRGMTSDVIALNLDVAATVLDAAEAPVPDGYEGRSLLPAARGEPDDRTGFFCEHRMVHPRIPRWEGFRTRNLMYARYFDQDSGEGELLYDLARDPQQLANVARDPTYADLLNDMRRRTGARE